MDPAAPHGRACRPAPRATAPALEPPTFNDEVVRILQARCQTCHRPGEHAPFSLLTYRDAFERRDDIRDAVDGRAMPPWKPVPGFGDFLESRRLSDARARDPRAVDRGGRAGGRSREAAAAAACSPTGWTLGPPDHVLEMAEPYTVPARASDVYRCFVIPTSFPEDRWVTKVEYAPGDREARAPHPRRTSTRGRGGERSIAPTAGPGYTCFGGPGFPPRAGSPAGRRASGRE